MQVASFRRLCRTGTRLFVRKATGTPMRWELLGPLNALRWLQQELSPSSLEHLRECNLSTLSIILEEFATPKTTLKWLTFVPQVYLWSLVSTAQILWSLP